MRFPDPARAHPVTLPGGDAHPGTVFLNRVISHPNWQVGDFTYASDFDAPQDWAARLAPYLFEGSAERLVIGRYGQIAHGARFLTAGANHAQDGLSTYPFPIFDPEAIADYRPDQRDTVVGHDVWIGYGAIICPGARIGNGVIIGAGAVVRGAVPGWSVVTANGLRPRFDTMRAETMERLAWWHWPDACVAKARGALMTGDLAALERLAP